MAALKALFFGLLLCLLAAHLFRAHAHPGDDPISTWYRDLRQPGSGVSCCHDQDCSPVDYQITPDGYVAIVGDERVPIPPEKVIRRENPVGRAVLCRLPESGVVLCFVPASET